MNEGGQLHVERSGTGAPVLLLHGFTGSTRTWDFLSRALEPAHTVIAVDLPGHAQSGAPDDLNRYRTETFADELARLLDAEGIARCALLGYSLGGRTALRFALRHPQRVSRLVLESTSPGIAEASERARRRKADAELAEFIEREGVEAFVDRWERLPFWASQASLPAEVRRKQREIRLSHTARGLANSLRGAGQGEEESVLPLLGRSALDILCIVGSQDPVYVRHAEDMRAAMGRPESCRVETLSTGHAVHLEQPERYVEAVRTYLAR